MVSEPPHNLALATQVHHRATAMNLLSSRGRGTLSRVFKTDQSWDHGG